MNRNLKAILITIPLTFSLTGCIIVSGDDDIKASWIKDAKDERKRVQLENRSKIAGLEIGQQFGDVRALMGTPNFNEVFIEGGDEYQVLFYRTHRKHSDGETTKDECTPLIFVNGVLTSWGEKAYNKI